MQQKQSIAFHIWDKDKKNEGHCIALKQDNTVLFICLFCLYDHV